MSDPAERRPLANTARDWPSQCHQIRLSRATRRRYAITQVGVHHFPRTRGQQTGAHPRVIFRAFRELVKLYQQING